MIGANTHGVAEALFLRTFSDRITLVAQEAIDLDPDEAPAPRRKPMIFASGMASRTASAMRRVGAIDHRANSSRAALETAGIAVAPSPLARMVFSSAQVSLHLTDDSELHFDTIYPALRSDSNNELARQLGVELSDDRCIVVDAKQRTSVAASTRPAISSCRSIRSASQWATRR